jgi:hypothetical protein
MVAGIRSYILALNGRAVSGRYLGDCTPNEFVFPFQVLYVYCTVVPTIAQT